MDTAELLVYSFQFLFMVIVPAVVIPFFFAAKAKIESMSLMAFSGYLVAATFFGNIFWITQIHNHFYYEWDRLLLPFSFWGHQAPVIDGSGTWLAPGLSQTGLRSIWLLGVLIIYVVGYLLFYSKPAKAIQKAKQVIKNTLVLLTLCSIVSFGAWTLFNP